MAFEIVAYTRELLGSLNQQGVRARALGGVAVALRCPSASHPPLARDYHDMDLLTERAGAQALSEALSAAGFEPAERFNALHGHSRMMFSKPGEAHMDVLVDEFVMCHKLSFRGRLDLHDQTVGLADLLLTKLQIAKINHKDVLDVAALLLDNQLGAEPAIDQARIVEVLSNDWGWWRTVTANLKVVEELLPSLGLAADQTQTTQQRLQQLSTAIGEGKRTLRWKARAKIGERVDWRFEPEEVAT
jgi:hypothetical protein